MEKNYKWTKVDILSSLCIFLLFFLLFCLFLVGAGSDESLVLCECDSDWLEVGFGVGFLFCLAFISFCVSVGTVFAYIKERFTIKRRISADNQEASK